MFFFQTGKSKIPLYNTLNIQLKGYDFPVLESYQGFVHHIGEIMGIEVADGYVNYIHVYLDSVFLFSLPLVPDGPELRFFLSHLLGRESPVFAFGFNLDIAF
jgi:hypothetical protein